MKRLFAVAVLLLLALASTATPSSAGDQPGCYMCEWDEWDGMPVPGCGVGNPGYWNCGVGCIMSSPGCGAGAMLPVDADGSVGYAEFHLVSGAATSEVRPCDGVLVAHSANAVSASELRTATAQLIL